MKKLGTHFAFFILMCMLVLPASAAELLIPGGQVIGMSLGDDTVTVAAIDEALGAAARDAGLKVGDRILCVDNQRVSSAQDIRDALLASDGDVALSIQRSGKNKTLHLCPTATENGPRLGVYLKQGVTGIGTVTWYDPDSDRFGALGHGVNTQAGDLLQLKTGSIFPAAVLSVKKGKCGTPGQLMGAVTDTTPLGDLAKNTAQGVFGTTAIPMGQALPTAETHEIRTGPATIRSTISGNTLREYSVEILKIYPTSKASGRNMLIKVTDPALLSATGGIVQGMSGSPIIQDGKLVGAVTHVLVNDPTTGYGIFIENMLDAAA